MGKADEDTGCMILFASVAVCCLASYFIIQLWVDSIFWSIVLSIVAGPFVLFMLMCSIYVVVAIILKIRPENKIDSDDSGNNKKETLEYIEPSNLEKIRSEHEKARADTEKYLADARSNLTIRNDDRVSRDRESRVRPIAPSVSEKRRAAAIRNNFKITESFHDQLQKVVAMNVDEMSGEIVTGIPKSVGEHLMQADRKTGVFREVYISTEGCPSLKDSDLSVVDVETTGLTIHDEVVELAAIRFGSDGSIIKTFQSLVRPRKAVVSDEARSVHGLSQEDLVESPFLDDIWGDVLDVVRGSVVFAHNAAFDVRLIQQSLSKTLWGTGVPIVDTLLAYRVMTEVKCNVYRLESLTRGLAVEHQYDGHRAMEDCRKTASLVLRLKHAFPNIGVDVGSINFDHWDYFKIERSGSSSEVDPIGIAKLGRTRPPFEALPVSTKRFRFSEKSTRFYVSSTFASNAEELVEMLESLGLIRAKRLTGTVKYFYGTSEEQEACVSKGLTPYFIDTIEDFNELFYDLESQFRNELEEYKQMDIEKQLERWKKNDPVCPKIRPAPLNPAQYIKRFSYPRWD